MKILFKYIFLPVLLVTFMTGCADFGDINDNPNLPTEPETKYLLLRSETMTDFFVFNATYNPWTQLYPEYISERKNVQHTKFAQLMLGTSSLYRNAIYPLDMIIAMNKGDEQATPKVLGLSSSNTNQIAAATTLRAYFYMHLTDCLGDIVFSEADKGKSEGLFFPKFDSQKSIYEALDKELNEVYGTFEEGKGLNANFDIIYKGNISAWKKLNASLRMMLAIKLSDVDPAAGKARFAKAYADGGIVEVEDCMIRPFLKEDDNSNLLYRNIKIDGRWDFAPSDKIINHMLELNDPRLRAYATPAQSDGTFRGWSFGGTQEQHAEYDIKDMSEFNPQFYQQDSPVTIISSAYIWSLISEAAYRGWISGDYKEFYNRAVKESFKFYGVAEGFSLADVEEATRARLSPNLDVEVYLAQEAVKLDGNDNDIKKIVLQRWIANFMQDGVQSWCDWRRFDYPDLKPGPVTPAMTVLPQRLKYHTDDINANMQNYKDMLKSQGPDEITTRVWWDVKANK